MIAASFLFFITWIYIYFDFSSSSLIQALQLTTDGASGWLVSVIKTISAVYSGTQAAFKACSALLRMLAAHARWATTVDRRRLSWPCPRCWLCHAPPAGSKKRGRSNHEKIRRCCFSSWLPAACCHGRRGRQGDHRGPPARPDCTAHQRLQCPPGHPRQGGRIGFPGGRQPAPGAARSAATSSASAPRWRSPRRRRDRPRPDRHRRPPRQGGAEPRSAASFTISAPAKT